MESELFATAHEDNEVGRMIGERNSVGLEDEMADIIYQEVYSPTT